MVAVAFGLAFAAALLPEPQAAPPLRAPTIATLRQGEGPHRLALPVAATEDEVAARRPSLVRGELARFLVGEGRAWRVVWDRRSGLPMLFEGPGLPLNAESGESHARGLLRRYPGLLGVDEEVALDGAPDGDHEVQYIRFKKATGRAHGTRLTFVVNHGRLIQVHADRWLPRHGPPTLTSAEALAKLREQAELSAEALDLTFELTDVTLAATAEAPGVYTGVFGRGYDHIRCMPSASGFRRTSARSWPTSTRTQASCSSCSTTTGTKGGWSAGSFRGPATRRS